MPHIHIRSAFQQLFTAVGISGPPDRLYHYAPAIAFQGIIESGSVFATRSDFLDDRLEYAVARARYLEVMEELLREAEAFPDDEADSRRLVLNHARHVIDRWERISSPPWVVSFSEDPDMLSQWRSYADDGRGFAIGFPSASLGDLNGSYPTEKFLAPCIYDSSIQRSLLRQFLEHLLEFEFEYTLYHGYVDPQFLDDEGDDMSMILAHFACFYKDHSYREEREWRLVIPDWGGSRAPDGFRVSDSLSRPYIHYGFGPGVEWEVWLGPRARKEAELSARLLCRSNDSVESESPILRSAIPLRY